MRRPIAFLVLAHVALGAAVVALGVEVSAAGAREAMSRDRRDQEALRHDEILKKKDAELQYLCEALLESESREFETRSQCERTGVKVEQQKQRAADIVKRETALRAAIRSCEAELNKLRKDADDESDEDRYRRLMRAGMALVRSGKNVEGAAMLEEALRIKVDNKVALQIRDEMDWKVLEALMMDGFGRELRSPTNK